MTTTTTRLLIYNSKRSNSNFHLVLSLWRAARELPDVEAEIASTHAMDAMLGAFRPDVVVALGGEEISPEWIKARRRAGVAWVLWTTEDPFELALNRALARRFDWVFTSDKASRDDYDHRRRFYLPLAASPDLFFRPVVEDPERLRYDLVFVGTPWPNRLTFLKDLVHALRAHDLRGRFLLPTNPHIPADEMEALGLLPFERDLRLSVRDLATLQNRSRFALTLFRDYSRHGTVRPQTSPTNRFFETALAGTSQIVVSSEIDIAGFYPDLAGGVEQCRSVEEIIAVLLAARRDPESRNRGARALQQFILDRHLYVHRLREMLEVMGRPPGPQQ